MFVGASPAGGTAVEAGQGAALTACGRVSSHELGALSELHRSNPPGTARLDESCLSVLRCRESAARLMESCPQRGTATAPTVTVPTIEAFTVPRGLRDSG